MTTAHDRAATPADRSVLVRLRGIPWWAAALLGLLPTVGCVTADVVRTGTVGLAFFVGYPVGCVLAALAARRDGLFVPMVQPPLALAVSVPVAVAVAGSLPTSGGLGTVLALAGPLIAGFPAMAITTTLCLAIGAARLVLQPLDDASAARRPTSGRSGTGASSPDDPEDRGEGRRRPDGDRPAPSEPRAGTARSGSGGPARTPLRVTSRGGTPADEEQGPARGAGVSAAGPPRSVDDVAVPTEPAPRVDPGPPGPGTTRPVGGSAVGTDEEPARRSPLVLPPDEGRADDRAPDRSGRPVPSRDAERRRRVREERMRADRMREERRREGQREAAQAEQRRESDRWSGTEHWGPRRRPEG